MTIAEKIVKLDEEADKLIDLNNELEQTLYGTDTGGKSFYDAFWDAYQDNGNRLNYQYSFCAMGWNDNTFKPKYDLTLGKGYTGTLMFWECYVTDLAETLEKQGIKLDTTLCGYMEKMFQNAKTKRVPELNCSHAMDYNSNGLNMTFINSQVETIDKLIVHEALVYKSTFQGCTNLKNIVFEGVIGQDINFQWSTLLSRPSIESIVNHLSDTASGKTLTLSKTAVNNAFSTEEWNTLVSTKSNWTITLV